MSAEYKGLGGITSKAEITKTKQLIEANGSCHKVTLYTGIWKYAYNDERFAQDNSPDHKKLPNSVHDPYIDKDNRCCLFSIRLRGIEGMGT